MPLREERVTGGFTILGFRFTQLASGRESLPGSDAPFPLTPTLSALGEREELSDGSFSVSTITI